MDYFKLLGVPRGATQEQIKQAYRDKAKQHHPDRHLDPKEKEKHAQIFKEINAAYEVLKNPSARHYHHQPRSAARPRTNPQPQHNETYFQSNFNNSRHAFVNMPLTEQELISGCTKVVHVKKKFACGYCNGARTVSKCEHCGGTGVHLWATQKVDVNVPPNSRKGQMIILKNMGAGDIPSEAGDLRITII